MPTINNKIANKALKPELSILSPNFWPICTPIIEPVNKILTKIKFRNYFQIIMQSEKENIMSIFF